MENLLKKSPVFIVLHSFQKRKKTAPDVPRINLWKTRVSISFHSSRMPPSRRCLSFRPHPEALSASVMSSSALVSTKHSFTHPSWARHPESHWFLARDTRSSLCWLSVGQLTARQLASPRLRTQTMRAWESQARQKAQSFYNPTAEVPSLLSCWFIRGELLSSDHTPREEIVPGCKCGDAEVIGSHPRDYPILWVLTWGDQWSPAEFE